MLDRLDGDQAFLNELLVMFRSDAPLSLKSAEDCLRSNDLPGLSRAAHAIKGMLRNLAMHNAAELADALEKCSGASRAENCERHLLELKTALERVLRVVESHLAGAHA